MEALVLTLLLLAAVLISSVIDQIVPKVSSPLIQIALGVIIALFASSNIEITLDPELFLVLFIAPLLYDSAKNADRTALWHNKRPVLALAIGLVVATALIVGYAVNLVIPSIPLAAAFALGAALGPTDAVAVETLSKETSLPNRQKNILAGEFLLNDASGIVSFQFALAAVVTGTFSLFDASVEFAFSFFGGIVVGVVLGYIGNFAVKKVREIGLENTTFHVLFEVFIPFIVYLVSSAVGVSGIIAVVTAGLVNALTSRGIGPSISRMNIVSTSVWRVLTYALNGVVFVLLGTQLPKATQHSWEDVTIGNFALIGYVLALTALIILVRFLWILAMEALHNRRTNGTRHLTLAAVRSALLMTLAGPKGTITLSIMFTLPQYLSLSSSSVMRFPQRDLLIFLACGVIVCTLLLASFVAPLLAPRRPRSRDEEKLAEINCNLEILRRVVEELTARQTPENRRATQKVLRSYNDRIARIKDNNDIEDENDHRLRMQALEWERAYTIELINQGKTTPAIGYKYIGRLTRREELLEHGLGKWSPHAIHLRLTSFFRIVSRTLRYDLTTNKTEQAAALRKLQAQVAQHIIGKLKNVVVSSEIPTEKASALLLEYQRICASLHNARPSLTAIAKTPDNLDDIHRIGLRLELEQIQTMYEEGNLSRMAAKRLRENVYLMQVDLEDNV